MLRDLLTVQFPRYGCKLKIGEFEYPSNEKTSTSDFLARLKGSTDGAVLKLPSQATDTLKRY